MTNSLPISDFAEGIFDGPHATQAESVEGPIFLGIKNITPEGRLNLAEIRHISETEFPRWTKRVEPSVGDIVFSYEATLHRYAVIPEGFRGCLGRRLGLVRLDRTKADPRFVHYYFLSELWRRVAESWVISGATVDRLPIKDFPKFAVSFPPLSAQKRIASILSAYDDLIENNLRRMGLLEEAARQLYREWFVRLRFPGHESTPVHKGVPDGWAWKRLDSVIDLNPKTVPPSGEKKAWVSMSGLSENSMLIDEMEFKDGSSGTKFQRHDTLLARITPCLENGKTAFVQILNDGETSMGSTEFIVMRSSEVSPEFVYLLARTDNFRGIAIASTTGSSGRQRVTTSVLADLPILVPSSETLGNFTERVRPMFDTVEKLQKQNTLLAEARDHLLPRLMRGEIEV